ncbi:glycosyltransferase [Pseudarthrobacter sp. P1]|uniref:glycosyltransferase n=1 Tax=Pseudarthrobacter sp. P1 TaxID=3418418 RepID=UPI003CF9FE53
MLSDPRAGTRKILLYGDVNLNIIDGSAIWLLSMAETLSRTNSTVTVLLKAAVERPGTMERIAHLENVHIVDPWAERDDSTPGELTARLAAQRMAALDSEQDFDVVISRGFAVSTHVANSARLGPKSWLYITDIPHPISKLGHKKLQDIRKMAARAHRMFAQTPDARAYLESIAPEACGKTLLLNPMVPDEYFHPARPVGGSAGLRLAYSGKFAQSWRTLEMCGLPEQLEAAGLRATLTMIGDKFQEDPKSPDWAGTMREAIVSDSIRWLGGLSRDAAAGVLAHQDVALSWRSGSMNDSFEISTKVLEAAAMGIPPLLNRTAAHERLLGADYPLFIDDDSPESVVGVLAGLGTVTEELRARVSHAVAEYSVTASAQRLEGHFQCTEVDYALIPRRRKPTRVLLAGHDFKFAGELVDLLMQRADIELKFDRWPTLHTHNVKESEALLEWADVIVCEWAGPNAVWYSNNKRRRQKLIVRLHMFELNGLWLPAIDTTEIDTLVCVSDLYVERVRAVEGWESVNIKVIPNAVDAGDLARPKLDGSEFRLGMVGIVPIRKRLDRAVDLMEQLLELDERYTLHVRGRMPWEYDYEWKKPFQREAYTELFARIGADERLRNAIVFEPFGADMGSWLRKIGFVLSPSSDESFHLAPAEGMASGAVPVFWPRPGVEGIFGSRWLVQDTNDGANTVFKLSNDAAGMRHEVDAARDYAARFDTAAVAPQWLAEIL